MSASLSPHYLLLAYDLCHLHAVEGPAVSREHVLDYLRRANPRASAQTEGALERSFERVKVVLSRLGVQHSHYQQKHGDDEALTWFTIHNAETAKQKISALLDDLDSHPSSKALVA